jgi:hypothetical protein
MAKLLPLDSITRMSDMRAYANAEAAVAAEKCPGAYNDYMKAIQILDTYSTFEGTSLEITYVELSRQAVKDARKTWYAIGCPDPKVVSPEPSTTTPQPKTPPQISPAAIAPGAGAGNLAKFLLAGGALFVVMMVFAKDKKKPRRKTTRRRTRKTPTRRRRTTGKRVVRRRTTTYYR